MSERDLYGAMRPAHTAGDGSQPARRIGVPAPAVSKRPMSPAERALSVAAVMELARAILQPAPGKIGAADRAQDDTRRRR